MKIAYFYLDFSTWNSARSWSYSAQLALEEGFAANGIECMSIPAICGLPSRLPASWLNRARELCAGREFDQVWVELVHSPLDQEFLEWLSTLAPVRVGMLPESLDSDPAICTMVTNLEKRRSAVEGRLHYMTHVLAVDEADAARIDSQAGIRALWWPQAIPARYIVDELPSPTTAGAIFPGSAYPWRKRWLDDPNLAGLCSHQAGPERGTALPGLFDMVNRHALGHLNRGNGCADGHLDAFVGMIRHIRRESFRLWMQSLQTGCAVVNLPSILQGHAGRVVEAMAAGRPVISWDIPNRPATAALFEDGVDILTFPAQASDLLVEHILRLQREPGTAARIARNARRKVLQHHTIEHRIRQIMDWLDTGRQPDYLDKVATDAGAAFGTFCKRFEIAPEAFDCSPPAASSFSQEDVLRGVGEAVSDKDLARAAYLLEASVQEHPDLSGMLATLHQVLGNPDKAEGYCLVAMTRAPDDAAPIITAATIALARSDYSAALAYCRQAYSLHLTPQQETEIAALVDRIPRGTG